MYRSDESKEKKFINSYTHCSLNSEKKTIQKGYENLPKRDLVSFKQLCRNRMFEFNAKQTRITRHTSAEKF